jgi:hypothetical protein
METILERRQQLCEATVTLDGGPAIITGAKLPFAKVEPLRSGSGGAVEFAWPTVERIISNGGAFRS